MAYISLKTAAKILKRRPDEVMAMVEGGVIASDCYCFPSEYQDGHQIAFFKEKVEELDLPKEKKDK